MINKDQAILIARNYIQDAFSEYVEDTPKISRLLASLRPDNRMDSDAWEVCFPWKPVEGMYRSSRGCLVLVDMQSGEVLKLS